MLRGQATYGLRTGACPRITTLRTTGLAVDNATVENGIFYLFIYLFIRRNRIGAVGL